MWSMCNEESLQGDVEGTQIFKAMMDVVHQYDTTRPITSAMNAGWLTASNDADVEDIIGVNYSPEKYDAVHARHPGKPMFGSEDTNQALSEKRAAKVFNFLQQKCGWKPYRMLTPTGMATADPAADNSTPEGKAQNRRVAVNVMVSKAVDGM